MRSGVAVITAQPAARMAGTLIGELTGRTQCDCIDLPCRPTGQPDSLRIGSQAVFSQGWLTGPDVSSMGFNSGIGASDEATDITAGAVYSTDGTMAFGIRARKRWLDGTDILLENGRSTDFGPRVTLHYFAETLPLLASVSTSYSHFVVHERRDR